MSFARLSLLSLVVLATAAAPVLADWDIGDSYKMHYPQLPDPNGWDVSNTYYTGVADDWLCTESGPVSDIHVWYSWFNDVPDVPEFLHVGIWTDDRTGEFSKPGTRLWHKDFLVDDPGVSVRPWGTGDQGWYDPVTGFMDPNNHQETWQLNLLIDPQEAFVQTQGNIYWLEVSVKLPLGTESQLGWKTSMSEHFEDDAVWYEVGSPTPAWQEITDPVTGVSLDMAFVITPEPGTLVLLGMASLGLVVYVLRRRRS